MFAITWVCSSVLEKRKKCAEGKNVKEFYKSLDYKNNSDFEERKDKFQ